MPTGFDLPESTIQEIIRRYQAGETGVKIATDLNVHWSTPYNVMRRRGVKRRGYSECQRQYALDENFFANIDSEAKAYWLGFITADGNVGSNRKQGFLTVNLQITDRAHLEKMVAHLQSELPLLEYEFLHYNGRLQKVCRAAFNSRKLSDDLIKLGVTPRKSLTVRPWSGPAELMPHYWRGAFDGDGTICKYNACSQFKGDGKQHHSVQWEIDMCGSQWVVQGFANFVALHGAPSKLASPRKNIFKVCYGGVHLPQIVIRSLYGNATVYLERKKLLADELLAITPRQSYLGNLTADIVLEAFHRLGSLRAMAAEFGCHITALCNIRKRLGVYHQTHDRKDNCCECDTTALRYPLI